MLKLILGNRTYSSWSLRGWLACRQSGLPFEEQLIPLWEGDWQARKRQPDIAVSRGTLPVLWHGDVAAWNTLSIIDYLDRLTDGTRFWPRDRAARAFIQSIATEMQSGYLPLRQALPMNVRRHYRDVQLPDDVRADVARIDSLWNGALERFGGPWLAGAEFGAADIMFAPVASRFDTYGVSLSDAARRYRVGIMAHPWMVEWAAAAAEEPWVLAHNERD